MIQILSDKAICMCPHGGQLQFMPTHMKADGMDGQALTIQDYTNAFIVGCAMPPPPAGISPCLTVLLAIDPMGQAMKVNGNNVVTQMVVSFTDKGWPIIVVSPGMSAMSINIDPSIPSFRKAEFAQASVQRQSGLPIGAGSKQGSSLKPFKDVIVAYWESDYARRKEKLILKGRTIGFGDGTPATLLVYKYDLAGSHKFIKQLTGSVKKNEVEVPWQFDYPDDVAELPDKVAGDEFYAAPEYFFELKVGGKSARSGLVEFRDYIEVELVDEEGKVIPNAEYIAHFADGSKLGGMLDDEGTAKLIDVPPGNVYFSFSQPTVKADTTAKTSINLSYPTDQKHLEKQKSQIQKPKTRKSISSAQNTSSKKCTVAGVFASCSHSKDRYNNSEVEGQPLALVVSPSSSSVKNTILPYVVNLSIEQNLVDMSDSDTVVLEAMLTDESGCAGCGGHAGMSTIKALAPVRR